RLVNCGARREATKEIDPVVVAGGTLLSTGHDIDTADRNEYVRARAEGRAIEAARCDADDGQVPAIHRDLSPEHLRVRAEVVLPERIAEHRYVIPAHGLIVSPVEETADRRLNAEHREVGSRYQEPVGIDRGLSGHRETDRERHVASDPTERGLRFLEVA